jgi:hypothetical protein
MALCAWRQSYYSLCALLFALCATTPAKAFYYWQLHAAFAFKSIVNP